LSEHKEVKVISSQTVGILIDGNNIGRSINGIYGQKALMNFDVVIPKVLNERALSSLTFFREGTHISEKLTQRLRRKYFGRVVNCRKSADIPLTIHAVQLAHKVTTIIIFSGDSDYCELVDWLKSQGVRVEVVTVHGSASKLLLSKSDTHYFIDTTDVFFPSSDVSTPKEQEPNE